MTDAEPMSIDALVRRSASARPDALALADAPNRESIQPGEVRRLTWVEVDRLVGSLAAQLADSGVSEGDAVGIQLANVVELPLTILACARLGAVAVPFPIQHREHELDHGFLTAQLHTFVTATRPDRPDQLGSVASVAGSHDADNLLAFGDIDNDAFSAISLDATVSAHAGATSRPDDTATICWTSGTTGTPKGVPRTHAQWMASSQFQVDQLSITSSDRILCPFPVVNMAGIGGMLLPWITAGAALHLHQPLDLPVFLQQLTGEHITYTVAPPPLLNMLLRNDEMLGQLDLSNIRAISSGSAPLDPWMVEGWDRLGIEIVNVFGSNEGAAMLSTKAAVPDPTERARYFPRPDRPGVEVRLVDLDSGDDITTIGRPGELRFTGPTVFDGYVGSDGSEFDDRGWFRTGDVFEWAGEDDPPRLLRFVDRAKDIIIRGGMNISAAEVEALVSSHPAVSECAVVGYTDPDMGERVGVFAVATDPGASPSLDDVVAHIRSQSVASYKLPERLEFVDQLPRNPVGKVVKAELRDRWAP